MPIRISKRTFLVAALLLSQLACLLVGVLWFGSWVRQEVTGVARERVLGASRQLVTQLASVIELMEIDDLSPASNDRDRLMDLLDVIRLPGDGLVLMVDRETGWLLGYPASRRHQIPHAIFERGVPLEQLQATRSVVASRRIELEEAANGERVFLAASYDVPKLSARFVLLQPEASLLGLIDEFATKATLVGVVIAVLLVILSGAVTVLVMLTYENRIAAVNRGLEETVEQRSAQVLRSRDAVIFGLAKLAESRDDQTGQHLDRICAYVRVLGNELTQTEPDLTPRDVSTMSVAAALHDIGKVSIPDAVLLKPGPLTPAERRIIERHPYTGGDTLMEIKRRWGEDHFLVIAGQIVFAHHERWDGSGYPFGLKGSEIPLSARIVALADVYDALTSRRSYKPEMGHGEARRLIVEGAGTQFDPKVVAAFERVESAFARIAREHRDVCDLGAGGPDRGAPAERDGAAVGLAEGAS